MKKAIGLIRVSTKGQAQEDRGGLAGQRATVKAIASTYDLEIVEWTELRGVSGTAVLDEPQFEALRRRIEAPEIHAVIVADLDRLMRPEDPGYYAIYRQFRDTGTVLYTDAGPKDYRSDRLLMMIESEIAVFERDKIRDRTMRAKEALRHRGRHVAGAKALPYAVTYRNEKTGVGEVEGLWGYERLESTIVVEVYRRFLAGERNFSKMARELGISRTLVRRVLTNPIYKGVREYTQRHRNGQPIPRSEEEVFSLQVIDDPLVAPDDWQTVQALLAGSNRRRPARENGECVYRGFLVCGSCGSPVHAHHQKRAGWQYRCPDSARRSRTCPTGSLIRRVVDAEIDARIEAEISDPDRLTALLTVGLPGENPPLAQRDAAHGSSQVADLRAERDRVVTSYEHGFRSLQDSEKRIREIDAQTEVLERVALAAQQSIERDADGIIEAVTTAFSDWRFLGHTHKREILAAMVQSIHIERAGRARARVKALDLILPTPDPSSPPNGPRSRTRRGAPAEKARRLGRTTGRQ